MKHKSLLALIVLPFVLSAPLAMGQDSAQPDLPALFAEYQAAGMAPQDIVAELVANGVSLDEATAYTVANAGTIGLAVSYAQAGVCLAPDQAVAAEVGTYAIDSASDEARNAVQAMVAETLSAFADGGCELLAAERNTDNQAFADAAGESAPGATGGGGAAPPEADDDEEVSVSQ